MQLTKREIIQKIYTIQEKHNLNLESEVQQVIRNEIVPVNVIKLINKYDKTFLQIYDAYNAVYLSRYKNPLYRNLRNSKLKIEELAVAISSLITKILISCTKIEDEEDKKLFCEAMDLQGLNRSIEKYIFDKDSSYLLESSKQIRELLEILYVD